MTRIREHLYRYRGVVSVAPIAIALIWAKPQHPWLLVGVAAMALGEAIRLWGTAHLGMTARSRRPQTGRLVTRGPYARTRHPLYWGNFLLAIGFATATGALWPWFQALVAVLFVVLYAQHALAEEAALGKAYPEAYAAYATSVPRWSWRWTPLPGRDAGDMERASFRRAFRVEAESMISEALLLAVLWARVRFL